MGFPSFFLLFGVGWGGGHEDKVASTFMWELRKKRVYECTLAFYVGAMMTTYSNGNSFVGWREERNVVHCATEKMLACLDSAWEDGEGGWVFNFNF